MPSLLGFDAPLALRLRTPLEAYRATKRALERLTEKRLLRGALGGSGIGDGSYCTLGALYVSLATPAGCAPEECPDLTGWDTFSTIEELSSAASAASALRDIVATNDRVVLGERGGRETNHERYERMMAWLNEQIASLI